MGWKDTIAPISAKPSWKDSIKPIPEEYSPLDSAARGAAEGLTLGAAPMIAGAGDAIASIPQANGLADLLAAYRKGRDDSRSKFEAAQAANPKSFFAGSLAGGIPLAAVTGGASEEGALAKGLSGLTKGILSPATSAGAITGAGYGALGSALGSKADLTKGEVGETALDALKGGTGGAVVGGVLGKLANGLAEAPKSVGEYANKKAVEATGAGKAAMKELSPEQVQSIGKTLLDDGTVSAFDSAASIRDKATAALEEAGPKYGELFKSLDESGSHSFNPSDVADDVGNQLNKNLLINGEPSAITAKAAGQVQDIIDTVQSFGKNPISFEQSQALKNHLTEALNSDPSNQQLRRTVGILSKHLDQAVDAASEGSGESYQGLKNSYKALNFAKEQATNKAAGAAANNKMSLPDLAVSTAAAAITHSPVKAVIAGVGAHITRGYGTSTAAAGARGVSNMLESVNSNLSAATTEQLAKFGQALATSGNSVAQGLGNVLIKAAEKDQVGRQATFFALMQNSTYRQMLSQYLGTPEK